MVSMCGLAEKKTQANADHILYTGDFHCTRGVSLSGVICFDLAAKLAAGPASAMA